MSIENRNVSLLMTAWISVLGTETTKSSPLLGPARKRDAGHRIKARNSGG